MAKIISSVIKIGGKTYEGKHHLDLIEQARKEGKDVSGVNRERDGMFKVSDGRTINRSKAKEEFGITHSEELWPIKNQKDEKLTFFCIDSGQYVQQCNRLADKGKNKVFYYTDAEKAFPLLQDMAPGKSFEYLESVPHLWDTLLEMKDEITTIVNFDSCNQDLIAALREHPDFKDKSIFGAGLGARIEEDREGFKKILKKLGLDVGEYWVKHGLDEVEKVNKENDDIYLKVDKIRGTMETQHLKKYEEEIADGTYDKLRVKFGPRFKDTQKFIIEKGVEGIVEYGMDGFFNKHGLLTNCIHGIEYAKMPYLGKPGPLPKQLQKTIDALTPLLKALGYAGMLATEEIWTKILNILIDPCPRGALPLSIGYIEWILNYPEVMHKVGLNEKVEIEIPSKYVLAVPLSSPENAKEDTRVTIEKGHEKFIKYGNGYTDDKGRYYVVKDMEVVANIVLAGNDWRKLLEQAKDEINYVSFDGKEETQVLIVDKYPELIEKANSLGVGF